ncbi:MAG: hypothetical protein ACPL3Q_05510, partial [Candidatus Ratteibacteria bacterium]
MPAKFNFHPAEFLPFKDIKVIEKVRKIKKADICKHPNKNFKISVIEDQTAFVFAWALHIVSGIKKAL